MFQNLRSSGYTEPPKSKWGANDMWRPRLSLEGEAGTDLVGSLVKVLGIEGSTKAEGDTRAQENVVGQGGNTAVVDLGLFIGD